MGKASVTHQVIIKPAIANTLFAPSSTANGLIKYINKETAIPEKMEMNLSCCFDKPAGLSVQDNSKGQKSQIGHMSQMESYEIFCASPGLCDQHDLYDLFD